MLKLSIESLNNISNLSNSLDTYLESRISLFKYPKVGKQFLVISRLEKINRYLLFGLLWEYIYLLENENNMPVLQGVGFSNLFLFIKETIHHKNVEVGKVSSLIFGIIYHDYFRKDVDVRGVPREIAENNITHTLGIIQWVYTYSQKEVKTILKYMDVISKNRSFYPGYLEWRFFNSAVNTSFQVNLSHHYINDSRCFSLFYGLYLTEWFKYSRNTWLLNIKISKGNQKMLDDFLGKLESRNLSLENFLTCLMKKQDFWQATQNNYLIWLVNHIPYFLSAFYQYDLRKIKKKSKNWSKIEKFIQDSYLKHLPYSYDYHGECVEILKKLGHNMTKELGIINKSLKGKSRSNILLTSNSHFSNIHTVVTYVIQPNNNNVCSNKFTGYGKYIKKIVENI